MDKASEYYSEDCGLEPHSGASQPGAAAGQGGVVWCGGRKGFPPSSCLTHMAPASSSSHDSLAEWSKALASGASPQGRGFEPHSCHFQLHWRVLATSGAPYGSLGPPCFTVGIWAQGRARGSSRAGRRPAQAWSGGLPIPIYSLQQQAFQDSLAEWSKALASGASP